MEAIPSRLSWTPCSLPWESSPSSSPSCPRLARPFPSPWPSRRSPSAGFQPEFFRSGRRFGFDLDPANARQAFAAEVPNGGFMIRRRELIKNSLVGAAALGPPLARALFAADSASPVVATKYGKVRGAFAGGVSTFRGIHYGANPEGA